MGRCYEFGVVIARGCDHAMVVPASGGHCECATCGATCPGQFAACGPILRTPNYVPVTAPRWAVARGASPSADAAPATAVVPAAATTVVEPVADGPLDPGFDRDRVDRLADMLEAVTKQLFDHDLALGDRIDLLADRLVDLQEQARHHAVRLQEVLAELEAHRAPSAVEVADVVLPEAAEPAERDPERPERPEPERPEAPAEGEPERPGQSELLEWRSLATHPDAPPDL